MILPTDTVYGLAATPFDEAAVRRLPALKQRAESQPIALLAPGVDELLELVPELAGRDAAIARALLPGPYTLVFANPARRFAWLAGARPETLGVRVPELPEPSAAILRSVRALAATSANIAGGPEPARFEDVPEELRRAVAVAIDGGTLPGKASTVLDFSGLDARVLREGAAPSAEALERASSALA